MTILGGVLIDLSLFGMLAGLVSVLKPLRFFGIRTRWQGLLVMGLSLLAFATGVDLPVSETRVGAPSTLLDEFVPAYQFSEFHSISIDAPKGKVSAAIWAVTPDEIRFYGALTWIRRFGRPRPAGALNAPGSRPILGTFLKTGFLTLADDPGREIVFGFARGPRGWAKSAAEFKALDQVQAPPLGKVAMNFRIQELDRTHCKLTTETRVYSAGTLALRVFAAYWRMIYPGSSLIRSEWLRAIKLRAEAAPDPGAPVPAD